MYSLVKVIFSGNTFTSEMAVVNFKTYQLLINKAFILIKFVLISNVTVAHCLIHIKDGTYIFECVYIVHINFCFNTYVTISSMF